MRSANLPIFLFGSLLSMLDIFARGIVECHHIPCWHACLDIAEAQALAGAACRERKPELAAKDSAPMCCQSQRGTHLLVTPLMRKAAPVHLETCYPVIAAFCLFAVRFCLDCCFFCLLLFNPSNSFPLFGSFFRRLRYAIPLPPPTLTHIRHVTLFETVSTD